MTDSPTPRLTDEELGAIRAQQTYLRDYDCSDDWGATLPDVVASCRAEAGMLVRLLDEHAALKTRCLSAERELAEVKGKLEASNTERYAAIKEMAKARGAAQDAQAQLDTDRLIGWEYAANRCEGDGLFAKVYKRATEAERDLATVKAERDGLRARVGELETFLSRLRAGRSVLGAGWFVSDAAVDSVRGLRAALEKP